MNTADLFPADPNYPAGVTDNDPHFDADPDGEHTPYEPEDTDVPGVTEDDKREDEAGYWLTWEEDYAQQVCQKRWGPL